MSLRQSMAGLHTWGGLLPGWLLFVILFSGTEPILPFICRLIRFDIVVSVAQQIECCVRFVITLYYFGRVLCQLLLDSAQIKHIQSGFTAFNSQ